jgi:uncharacterized membrane protein affecting hemolysin expression
MVSCAFLTTSIYQHGQSKLDEQSRHYSQALTSYLALTSAQYLLNQDSLGINVLLNKMQREGVLDFASIYDLNDQLVAQVGERSSDAVVFSDQITFQDSTAGYIQVGYNVAPSAALAGNLAFTVISVHLLLAALVLTLIWLGSDFIAVWIVGKQQKVKEDVTEIEEAPAPVEEIDQSALLVMRLEPIRLNATHKYLMLSAASLYGGKALNEHQDDLNIQFRQSDSAFASVCAGLLVAGLVKQLGPPLKLKLALHWSEENSYEAIENGFKHTSYLASISDQAVLISKRFAKTLNDENVQYEPYRNSLAPDGEVFEVVSVSNQELIQSQAEQLLTRR